MSTIGMVRDLAEVFMWIGLAGVGIAILCAIAVVVALARAAAGVVGGAVAVWIGGALLSLASGFSGQWIPALVAVSALAASLVLGAFARMAVRAFEARPKPEPVIAQDTIAAPATAPPVAPAIFRAVSVRTAAPESIR